MRAYPFFGLSPMERNLREMTQEELLVLKSELDAIAERQRLRALEEPDFSEEDIDDIVF